MTARSPHAALLLVGVVLALAAVGVAWWRTVRPVEHAPQPAPICECRCVCDVGPCPACPGGEECGL